MARAIIVDDSRFMRNIIRETLEQGGHQVLAEGSDGHEAVDLASEHTPDFMTLDITMRGKDGMTAAEEIINAHPGITIIIVSALSRQVLEQKHGASQAAAFITKPFEKQELLDLVSQHVKGV